MVAAVIVAGTSLATAAAVDVELLDRQLVAAAALEEHI